MLKPIYEDDRAFIVDFAYSKSAPVPGFCASDEDSEADSGCEGVAFLEGSKPSKRPSDAMKGGICCCFVNHTRSLILLLSFVVVATLFANTVLLNFAIVSNSQLIPRHFVAVTKQQPSVQPPVASESIRAQRSANASEDGVPVPSDEDIDVNDELVTQKLIEEVTEANKKFEEKAKQDRSEADEDEGHPVPSVEDPIEKALAAITYPTQKPNTRLILLTKATTAPSATVNATISETETTPAPSKPEASDKDLEATELPDSTDKSLRLDSRATIPTITEGSEVAFFERRWLEELQDWAFYAAPGIGILLGHPVGAIFVRSIGCHKAVFAALLLSAASVGVVPFVLGRDQLVVTILRVLQGFAFAPTFAFIGQNAAAWAALKEQLWFIATCIAGIILAPAISWSITNELIASGYVNGAFYGHSVFTFILSAVWIIFYRNTPQTHRWVNGLELNKVHTGKAQNNRLADRNSTSLVFRSMACVAVLLAGFGYFFAFAVITIFLPTYAHTVLHLTPYSTGAFVVTPFLFMAFAHWISYGINKYSNCCGLTTKVRIFNTLALGLTAIGFLGLAISAALHHFDEYSGFNNFIHAVVLLPLGFAINGFFQSAVIVGRYYTQYIVTHLQVIFGLAFVIVPVFVVFWTPLNVLRYWRFVFLGTAAILIIVAITFAVFGRGQPSNWAENSWDPTATHRMLQPIPIGRNAECGIIEMRTIDDHLKSSLSATAEY
uniref:MFS domain-containing protein n=1 Tax=Panagrellus redivivus TaxID=6233 RepID=A0A7E4VKK0_PANRE